MKAGEAPQKRIEQFIKQKLLIELGFPQKNFSLEATNLGIHNHVFFLDVEGEPQLVVKGIAKKELFKNLIHCANHLVQHNIRIPKILYAYEDRGFFKRKRLHIICEERINGKTAFELASPRMLLPEIARFFSHMHSVKRNVWGKINQGKGAGLYEYLMNKTIKNLQQLQRHDQTFASSLSPSIASWMKSKKALIQQISSFSLSHGDPNPGNVMISSDGQVYLLDVGHIRYLPRAIDYYTLMIHFCQDNQDHVALLEANYFTDMPSEEREEFTASHLFFKMYVLVNFGETLGQRLSALNHAHSYYEEFVTNFKKIKSIITEVLDA